VTAAAAEAPQPRAIGAARVASKLRDGASVLADLYEQGSAKIRLPAIRRGAALEAVALNTAGGITGGDRLSYAAEAGPRSWLTLATQTAERAYRARPGQVGRVETRLTVGPGATMEWLAQETILFDGCALERRIAVDMAPDATFLLVEPRVLGRAAMGETVRAAHLREALDLRREGRLVWADRLRLDGDAECATSPLATMGGARAFATLVYVAPDAESRLDEARFLLGDGDAAASAFDGALVGRIVSSDGYDLRRRLMAFLTGFRRAAPPRVWEM
jgi:urease accessory protein